MGQDFPDGPVVKNPPSNAGDTGSIPGRGIKIPHAEGQLSPKLERRPHTTMKSSPAAAKSRHSQRNIWKISK